MSIAWQKFEQDLLDRANSSEVRAQAVRQARQDFQNVCRGMGVGLIAMAILLAACWAVVEWIGG